MINPMTSGAFSQKPIFYIFDIFCMDTLQAKISSPNYSKGICNMKAGFSFQKQCVLQDFRSRMHTNKHFVIITSLKITEKLYLKIHFFVKKLHFQIFSLKKLGNDYHSGKIFKSRKSSR